MAFWVQIRGRDEDEEFPDAASYEILEGGVLKVSSGDNVHLYSPAHWQELLIGTRGAAPADELAGGVGDDLRWQ